MKYCVVVLGLFIMFFGSCKNEGSRSGKSILKQEIMDAEKAFAKMVKEQGVGPGFFFYADSNAVIQRGGKLITGKKAIGEYYSKSSRYSDSMLEWAPDFIDVSESGDLGYTYGRYKFSAIDSSGNPVTSEGLFHTVWKRQPDGSWRYVWD